MNQYKPGWCDHLRSSPNYRHVDVRLLEKMRLNCQVFKEEISIVHLNRQVVHLQSALQESYDEVSLLIESASQVLQAWRERGHL